MAHRRGGPGRWLVLVALILPSSGPPWAQDRDPAAGIARPAAQTQADAMVHCRLPAGIDRLGSQLTKVSPRRTIETTAEDCAERGGDVVDRPR